MLNAGRLGSGCGQELPCLFDVRLDLGLQFLRRVEFSRRPDVFDELDGEFLAVDVLVEIKEVEFDDDFRFFVIPDRWCIAHVCDSVQRSVSVEFSSCCVDSERREDSVVDIEVCRWIVEEGGANAMPVGDSAQDVKWSSKQSRCQGHVSFSDGVANPCR